MMSFAAVTLSMTQESYSTTEDSVVVTVCVQLEAGAMEGVTAVVSLSTGTNTALGSGPGADFVPEVDVQVSFESGSPLGSTECVDITITDDDTTEPDESFTVALTAVSDFVALGDNSAASVDISDNDCDFISSHIYFGQ